MKISLIIFQLISEKATINTSAFANGIYLLQVACNGKTSHQKLVISK